MEGMELTCFEIISYVGTAKSCYINAIHRAKEGKFDEAKSLMEEGNENFALGHKTHVDLIQKEASGNSVDLSLLLVHAEDQMMSTEICKILSEEFLDIYEKIK